MQHLHAEKIESARCHDEPRVPRNYMRDWVEEFASLCDANSTDKKGCSEQQIKFIDKWSGKLIWRYILRHLLSDGFGWTLLASRNLFFRHARKPKDDLQGQLTRLKGSWAAEWDDLVTEIRNQTNQSASQPTNRAMRQPTNERINLSINALSDFILSDLILSYRILSYVILSYLILSYLIVSIYLSINHSTKIVFHIAKISHPKSTIFQRA